MLCGECSMTTALFYVNNTFRYSIFAHLAMLYQILFVLLHRIYKYKHSFLLRAKAPRRAKNNANPMIPSNFLLDGIRAFMLFLMVFVEFFANSFYSIFKMC